MEQNHILWHIKSLYNHYGITEFIICLGYKGYAIKEFFLNYNLHMSDFTIHLSDNTITSHSQRVEPWKVTLIDTGVNTETEDYEKNLPKFCWRRTFRLHLW